MRAVGDHLDALLDQAVDDAGHALLVARNGAGGKDDAVAAAESDIGMIAVSDARKRRAWLPLAAGTERNHLVGRQIAVDVDVAKILDALEIAGLARDLRRRVPSPARPAPPRGRRRPPPAPPTRIRATLEAKVVTPTRPGALAIRSASACADVGFRGRAALADSIGGIAEQREAAFVAERTQLGLVGRRTDHRGLVDLPVAGMQHGSEPCAQDETVRFRDRMRHRHVFDIERAEREAAAERHDIDRNFRDAALAQPLGFEQTQQ